ncbi:MAG: PA2169 family four-helix-bundle protein [Eudoraea sp.]|nr:PA2169 family four-helix-bundle protein [Eudoraea sp.]
MTFTERISNRLNELLEKNYDAEKGYNLAADKVEIPSVKTFLKNRADQRRNFAFDLKREITEYGGSPEKDGSVTGKLHRTWMKLLSTFSGDETEQILEEVERGEKTSLEEYNAILEDKDITLPTSTENILIKHRDAIQAALNTAKVYEELVS